MRDPLRSVTNQFLGINPYLHSLWQSQGGWAEFHTTHIVHLAHALKAVLLPMGYTAAIEPSLQIRRLDVDDDIQNPETDVTIYDLEPARFSFPRTNIISGSGEVVLSIAEALLAPTLSEKEFNAIKIYEVKTRKSDRGQPVVWIELLSPSNKPKGRDAKEYLYKRQQILESGVTFVELDYLHESAPTIKALPSYRALLRQSSDIQTHPYRILIIDPHPEFIEGIVRIREFDVDEPIPALTLPLSGDDKLNFDFNAPYQETYQKSLYGLELVDYRELLINFDRYSAADQTRIALRILSVLQAAQSEVSLETGPFLVESLTLEEALKHIEALK